MIFRGMEFMNDDKQTMSFLRGLTDAEIAQIKDLATIVTVASEDTVFAQGDAVNSFYIVEKGTLSVISKNKGETKEICVLRDGDYFGEMAIYNQDTRSASVVAVADSSLFKINKDDFLAFIENHPKISELIQENLQKRNEELILREKLLVLTGLENDRLHVSIKGDPSLRHSAFDRERYESKVDTVMTEFESILEELLLRRSVYRIFINFNSGEIRINTIFDPFTEEIHFIDKLVNMAYIDRHFPKISYEDKSDIVRTVYQSISINPSFTKLPEHYKSLICKSCKDWKPVKEEHIKTVIKHLVELRDIENFYLRNVSINMILDAIRMQFNCDGTHIVSSKDYKNFLDEIL